MTREEAIKGLKRLSKEFGGYKPNKEMFDMAIDALKQPELHYDEWCETCKEYDAERHRCPRFNKVIKATVQEYEASMPVRCKDCKHYDSHDHRCRVWNHGVEVVDYCSCADMRGEK